MTQPAQRVAFEGSRGAQLAGRLDMPAGPARAVALFAHCFTCSKDIFAAGRIAAELNAQGIGVLRFDFTGLGSSEGEFAHTNFSSNLHDLRAAAAWLREHVKAPQLLIGHSLGGAAVLAVATDIPEVRAVVTLGAPADVGHIVKLLEPELDAIAVAGSAPVCIGGRTFTVSQEMIDDLGRHSLEEWVANLHAALLVMHSPVDNVVGVENAARLYAAARHPKSYISLDGADHLLSRREDAVDAARMLATWANRYLIDESGIVAAPAATAPVVVGEAGQGKFLNHVVIGDHHLMADEPVSVGGFDAGPSPYDLLGAALGACTSMTMRMYADRKKFAVRRITVEVTHSRVHADDCQACIEGAAPQGALIDHFQRRLTIDSDLSAAELASLVAIADRCPVHRTLEGVARITTHLVTA